MNGRPVDEKIPGGFASSPRSGLIVRRPYVIDSSVGTTAVPLSTTSRYCRYWKLYCETATIYVGASDVSALIYADALGVAGTFEMDYRNTGSDIQEVLDLHDWYILGSAATRNYRLLIIE